MSVAIPPSSSLSPLSPSRMADRSSQQERKESSHHPLHQIAESPTHKLLLKQWLKEEGLILSRVALRETQLNSIRKDLTLLHCSFFILHSLLLLILFCTTAAPSAASCRRSWVPCLCSLACSAAILWAVRYKADSATKVERLLEREREDSVLLRKCVEELKRKGLEFDLLKEVDALRSAKCLRMESSSLGTNVRWWSGKDFSAVLFLAASAGALGLTRFVLCG